MCYSRIDQYKLFVIQLTASRVILDTTVMKVRALYYSSSEIYGYKVYQFIKHHPKRHKVFIYLFTVSCNECFCVLRYVCCKGERVYG